MQETARRAFLAALVVIGVVVGALALWELRLLIALLFLAFIVAAAMRPSVEWLNRRRILRGVGIAIHYLALAGLVALLLWLVVPRAIDQVRLAIGDTSLNAAAKRETGWKHDALVALDSWLNDLPRRATSSIQPCTRRCSASRSSSASSSCSRAPRTGSSSATGRCGSSRRCCRGRSERSCGTPGT